jgi:hypothetical protein
MRIISTLLTLALLGGGAYWIGNKKPEYKAKVLELITTGSFHTLEARYTAKQLMESHRRDLLKTNKHTYAEPIVKFYPYLLLEVKYTNKDHQTGEGIILWDLVDGEMVINTKHWEKTHGFADCINSGTERYEFKILNLIAQNGGKLDRDGLSKALQIENNILDAWIDSCRKKKLLVQTGNTYRLHLQEPKLSVVPETVLHDRLATKSYKGAERLTRRYSSSQVRRIAECAFGNDFAIRNTIDIFLPVYSITVQNPDGSLHTSYWNAVNGKPLPQTSFIH